MKPKKTTEQRFWEKIDKNGPTMAHMTTPCWKWLAYINHDGYGNFSFSGRMGGSHRFSYQLHIGPIPEGMEVRHTCHNPACSNPDHLQLGTHIDNMKDLALSGRRKGFRVKYRRPLKHKPTLKERFWNKVNKDGPTMPHMDSPCWVWTDWLDISGCGRISVSGKLILAHRFSCEFFNGPIPDKADVIHDCNNPSCVNPRHLSIKIYITPRCADCGKVLNDFRSIRCRSCSKTIPFEIRFWSKVDKNGPILPHMDTPCWEWIGRRVQGKYGYFDVLVSTNTSTQVYAHRISWEISNSQPIPDKLYVLHKCDNPPCVNPDHLFLGTYKDNSDDMIRKGRAVHPKRKV